VAEAYPANPKDIDAIYNIQSCTKSVTAIIAGIAVEDGLITDLDEKLFDIFPGHFDQDISKRSITIKDALTMRTGLEFNNSIHTQHLYQHKGSSIEYVLSRKKIHPSGTVMNYNDGAPHLVSKVIESKTGMSMEEYAAQKLFKPLNIAEWKWERSKDGTTYGAFSLYLKPRDFGKIGQLLLKKGNWQGQQIIDGQYLEEATGIQVSANFNNEPYGYYFWILPADSAYAAYGHGGQFLLVAPEKDLVVVYTAWPYTSSEFFDQKNEMISLILQSCN
jgi:CubicO group peptidase (beta-lactamase class C family)